MSKRRSLLIAILLLLTPYTAQAKRVVFSVQDAGALHWAIHGDRAYLRNLDAFDSTFLPCCYNYWIDLTAFLSKQTSRQPLMMYVERDTPGHIIMVGNW